MLRVDVASFHLVSHPDPLRPLMRLPELRRQLRAVDGLRFWRLLGTGRGEAMSLSADLRRWALLAVWSSDAALHAFLDSSAVSRAFGEGAVERWDARLGLRSARGAWGGVGLTPSATVPDAPADGPVAILTRATIRWARLRAFYAAISPVDAALAAAPGRLRSVGIGEWPLKRQATFSLWRDEAAVRDFAYGGAEHAEVIRRTRAERWYAEELFARFSVSTLAGTWGGADPLGGR